MKKTNGEFGGRFEFLEDWVPIYDEDGNFETYFPVIDDVYIREVIYNNPATIVKWSDGTKTVTKCRGADVYSKEVGLIICCMKKLTSGAAVKRLVNDWVPHMETDNFEVVTLHDVRKNSK